MNTMNSANQIQPWSMPNSRDSQAWLFDPPPRITPMVHLFRLKPAMSRDSGKTEQARRAALDLNENWKKANASNPGRLAVIDMFSGCGGMSAGFKSVNGMEPAYRIAGAIDIDKIANTTYEAN